jgi:hypothetical protein
MPADVGSWSIHTLRLKRAHSKRTLLALYLLVCSSLGTAEAGDRPCKPAVHARIPKIAGLAYAKARRALLAQGWRPLRTKPAGKAGTDPDLASGNGLEFWSRGYVEVEACAGTGLAPCAFLFKDAHGNRLRVTTAGEEDPKERSSAKVTGFKFVCPQEATQ